MPSAPSRGLHHLGLDEMLTLAPPAVEGEVELGGSRMAELVPVPQASVRCADWPRLCATEAGDWGGALVEELEVGPHHRLPRVLPALFEDNLQVQRNSPR